MRNEASVSLVLDTKEKTDKHLLKIRVTFNRTPYLYSAKTSKRLTESQFKNDNLKITKEAKEEAQKALNVAKKIVKDMGRDFSFAVFKEKYHTELFGERLDRTLIADYSKSYYANLQNKTQTTYATAVNWVCRYKKKARLSDINPKFVTGLVEYMKKEHLNQSSTEMNENTIRIYLRSLSAIYQHAMKEGLAKAPNPFRGNREQPLGSIPRQKGALNDEELDRFISYKPQNKSEKLGQDFFVLSLELCGANLGDILCFRNKNIQENEIHFIRRKTRKSKLEIALPITRVSEILLNEYGVINQDRPDDYILPFLNGLTSEKSIDNKIHDFIRKVNVGISSICEAIGIRKITTYNARHTYAVKALDCMTAEQIQKFLGHTNVRTTDTYLKSITTSVKGTNKKVLEGMVKGWRE